MTSPAASNSRSTRPGVKEKFRQITNAEKTVDFEFALSHNKKQVCIRRISDPKQFIVMDASAMKDFVTTLQDTTG